MTVSHAVSLGGNPGDREAGVVELPYVICNPSVGEFLRAVASHDIQVFFIYRGSSHIHRMEFPDRIAEGHENVPCLRWQGGDEVADLVALYKIVGHINVFLPYFCSLLLCTANVQFLEILLSKIFVKSKKLKVFIWLWLWYVVSNVSDMFSYFVLYLTPAFAREHSAA